MTKKERFNLLITIGTGLTVLCVDMGLFLIVSAEVALVLGITLAFVWLIIMCTLEYRGWGK